MSSNPAGGTTTRSGRSIKESEKKKHARETENLEEPPTTKRKRARHDKENRNASQGNVRPPEFKITTLVSNKTSLKGNPVNLQARKVPLPLPRSLAGGGSTIQPATVVAGGRRTEPSLAPRGIRKLTPDKAAQLAAARSPFGAVMTGRNGHADIRHTPAHGVARTSPRPSASTSSKRPPPNSGSVVFNPSPKAVPGGNGPSARLRAATPSRMSRHRSPSPQDDHAVEGSFDEVDDPVPSGQERMKTYRVSNIAIKMPDDASNAEDEDEGIPREFWISPRLRLLAKRAIVISNSDRIAESEDGNTGAEDYFDDPRFEDEPDHEPENDDEQQDPANLLYEDHHEGEYDDAPEIQDEDYDSDAPLAQRRRLSTRTSEASDPRAGIPRASRIRERVDGKHPCVADYEPDARHILFQAIPIFKALVSSENAYPDKLTELIWAKQAWWEAADNLDIELAPNRECTKIIAAYSWHLRGEMKTAARSLVETVYRFRASGQTDIQLRNRERAAALRKGDTFVYQKRGKTVNDHEGLYQADVIQQMANRIYFKNKKDDGIILKDKYSPFPVVAFALILAAVECGIDEWSDGSFTKVPFTEEKYAPIYRHHLRELRQYEAASDDLQVVTQLCQWIYEDGRIYAKAGPDETLVTRSLGPKAYAKGIADFKRAGRRFDGADEESAGEDGN